MLQEIADTVVLGMGFGPGTRLAGSVSYFLYDSVKIILLLFLMITVIGLLRTYLPQNKVKHWLSGKNLFAANFSASLFGAITPFCSCSSIPIFLGFVNAGVPLGVSFSFLVTSPLVNEYLVVLMLGFFGWKIAAAYVIAGMSIGIGCGLIFSRMNLDHLIEKDMRIRSAKDRVFGNFVDRVFFGLGEAKSILKRIWLWILFGVAIGALVHDFVPQGFFESVVAKSGFFGVPIATVVGVPIYAGCASVVPIAAALFQKGVPIGTVMALMMSVAALSLPEAVILRRAMKLKLIAIFFGVVALGIVAIGYLVNALQSLFL
ncbi:MAG: permease [Candidatus Woesearchaeota archaeon]